MAYEPQTWNDNDPATPLSAARLSHIEQGILDVDDALDRKLTSLPYGLSAWAELDDELSFEQQFMEVMQGVRREQPYREPESFEVTSAINALVDCAKGAKTDPMHGVGAAGFDYVFATNYAGIAFTADTEHAPWGIYALTPGIVDVHTIVQAPHPQFDSSTERLAHSAFTQASSDYPGVMVAVAGSNRTDDTGENPRDVAQQTGSMFHQICSHFVKNYGARQIQFHSFNDDNSYPSQIFLCAGATEPSPGIKALADRLEAKGYRVGRGWDEPATAQPKYSTKQDLLAAGLGTEFIHIGVNRVRHSITDQRKIINAIIESGLFSPNRDSLFVSSSSPQSIGADNSVGLSEYAARADHVHRLTENDPKNGEYVKRKDGDWCSVPASEVAEDLQLTSVIDEVTNATYSATGSTLMKRTSSGAVSVADATAGTHAMNRRSVEALLKSFAELNSLTWPPEEGDS